MADEREPIPQGEMEKPMQRNEAPPLEFFPEREWLDAMIDKVEYRYVYRKGYIQYLQNSNKEDILDDDGEKIARREFNITFIMKAYDLPNGDPRKSWLSLGASMGQKAHLPKVLEVFGYTNENPTPSQIIEALEGKEVRFQVSNKKSETTDKEYQNVIWDSLKLVPKEDDVTSQQTTEGKEVEWDKDLE